MVSLFLFLVSLYMAVKTAMVELRNNLQEVYAKWELRSKPSISVLKENKTEAQMKITDGPELKNDRASKLSKQNGRLPSMNLQTRSSYRLLSSNLPRWNGLSQFKMSPTTMLENPCVRPYVGKCCAKCLPISTLTSMSKHSTLLGIQNILNVQTQNRENNLLVRMFHHAFFILQRHHNYIYKDVSKAVLESARVTKAIEIAATEEKEDEELSDEEFSTIYYKHRFRARELLFKMKSAISSFLLKVSGWVMFKLLNRMLLGIQIHKGQIENIKHISKENAPVIYLPLHRSHLDYILLTFILYMNDLRVPFVAAGDNLRIPFFGNLLRNLGAFFIKRKLDQRSGKKDHVYRAVLHTYMAESLREGHDLEFFIEGGRSRTGKTCLPKSGLLSVVVDSLLDGCMDDAYIVPVAVSYEKILDGNFILEQLGKQKVMENFISTIRSIWNVLHSNYGSVRVDFCQPFSLKEFMQAAKHFRGPVSPKTGIMKSATFAPYNALSPSGSNSSLYGTDVVIDDMRQTIRDIAEHIVYDATNAVALMSTNVLSFLFLTKHRKGATLHQLTQSLNWLQSEIRNRKRDVGFTGEPADIIRHACRLLGNDLITIETIEMEWSSYDVQNNNVKIYFFKPVIRLPYVLELQYYANSVLSTFLMDSIVVNALFALLDEEIEVWRGCRSQLTVLRQKLTLKALELCDILQYEFIFAPPCTDISCLISETIDNLISSELLKVLGTIGRGGYREIHPCTAQPVRSYGFDDSSEEDDDEFAVADQNLQVCLSEESISQLQFYRCILSPYIESYWLAACSLNKLMHLQKDERVFFEDMQKTAQDRLHKGLLLYEESFAAETLRNAQRLFEHWKVIESYRHDSVKIVYLHTDYDNEDKIGEVIYRIEEFRK